jgi:Tol biopolymer transport system component
MDVNPRFSPDGTRICYMRYGDGYGPEVCVINANGSGHRVLASGELPVWSPDGNRIAYVASTADVGTNGTVWIMNADGSAPVQVTRSRLE